MCEEANKKKQFSNNVKEIKISAVIELDIEKKRKILKGKKIK